MNIENLSKKIKAITNFDEFEALEAELSKASSENLFTILFKLATTPREQNVCGIAGKLLISIEPTSRLSCYKLLAMIHESQWDVSNKEIPFYLISQFGKLHLQNELSEFLSNFPGLGKSRVHGVEYWLNSSTSSLNADLHYFAWQDAIESNDI